MRVSQVFTALTAVFGAATAASVDVAQKNVRQAPETFVHIEEFTAASVNNDYLRIGFQTYDRLVIPNGQILLKEFSGNTVYTGTTDENGIVEIDAPAGEYLISTVWPADFDYLFNLNNVYFDLVLGNNGIFLIFAESPAPTSTPTPTETSAAVTIASTIVPTTTDLTLPDIIVRAFVDANNNDALDDGEGSRGVVCKFLDSGNNLIGSETRTNANGVCRLRNIPDGVYLVVLDVSPITGNAQPDQVTEIVTVTNGRNTRFTYEIPTGSVSATVIVPTIATITSTTAASTTTPVATTTALPGQVLGQVFADTVTANGSPDAGEGLVNIPITIANPQGQVFGTTLTNANGVYQFAAIPAGDYSITADISSVSGKATADYRYTTVTVVSGQIVRGDILVVLAHTAPTMTLVTSSTAAPTDAGVIVGSVFEDDNNDDIVSAGEGIAGVPVALMDAATFSPVSTTTTGADGSYLFSGLAPGQYLVTPTLSTIPNLVDTGAISTPATVFASRSTVVNFEVETTDEIELGSISGMVFVDVNGDGVASTGEGLPNIAVSLLTEAGMPIRNSFTSADGSYHFLGLEPATYTLGVQAASLAVSGEDFIAPVVVLAGEATEFDVEVITTDTVENLGNIEYTVFKDTNQNGARDYGEFYLSGATLDLIPAVPAGTGVKVDTNGKAFMLGIPYGTYEVTVSTNSAYTAATVVHKQSIVVNAVSSAITLAVA